MEEIIFVAYNKGKIAYAQKKLKIINLKIFEYNIDEPRSDDVKYFSKYKVIEAYKLVKNNAYHKIAGFG